MSRPLPRPTDVSRPHWEAAARGQLAVQRCGACGRRTFPPARRCPFCAADALEWTISSGRGVVHTFTVVWRPPTPDFDVPFVIATIELEEGWYMLSNVVGCDVDAVHIGMAVAVEFRTTDEEAIVLPVFAPVADPADG